MRGICKLARGDSTADSHLSLVCIVPEAVKPTHINLDRVLNAPEGASKAMATGPNGELDTSRPRVIDLYNAPRQPPKK